MTAEIIGTGDIGSAIARPLLPAARPCRPQSSAGLQADRPDDRARSHCPKD